MKPAIVHLIEWFRTDPIPAVFPSPAIVVGGTATLGAFVDAVARLGQGRLCFETAFGSASIEDALPQLKGLDHKNLHLAVATSSIRDCQQIIEGIGSLPWGSLRVAWRRGLHSKVYTFIGNEGASACLIGSHNLTPGGAIHNDEVGVLFHADAECELSGIARAFEMRINGLVDAGAVYFDSLRFPQIAA